MQQPATSYFLLSGLAFSPTSQTSLQWAISALASLVQSPNGFRSLYALDGFRALLAWEDSNLRHSGLTATLRSMYTRACGLRHPDALPLSYTPNLYITFRIPISTATDGCRLIQRVRARSVNTRRFPCLECGISFIF